MPLSATSVLAGDPIVLGDGTRIERYRMQAGRLAVEVMTFGAAIVRLEVPDKTGEIANVVLSHGDVRDALHSRQYFGAIVGRLANRLAHGRLRLGASEYRLSRNDGEHHLHGGSVGFDRRTWCVNAASAGADAQIELGLDSADGEEGYPGALHAVTRYLLRPDGELRIELEATTDQPTVVNLTNHSYFNLHGEGRGNVLGHRLTIAASEFLPVDAELIPTGEIRTVADTAFDFRAPALIGAHITRPDDQLRFASGFDHCFVLARERRAMPALAARVEDPASGRWLEVWTDRPGLQFYSGNFLDGTSVGTSGVPHGRHAGLCLEAQGFPDAPNNASFPSVGLQPGERYRAVTLLRFGA
jgi:aldose 1-epimerase